MKTLFTRKRTLLSGATTAIVALLVATACTEDRSEEFSNNGTYPAVPEVILELENFNETLSQNYPETRRDLKWYDWLSIAIEDGKGGYKGAKWGGKIGSLFGPHGSTTGAVVGGVIVGGAKSYLRYDEVKNASLATTMSTYEGCTADRDLFTAGYANTKDDITVTDYSLGISFGLDSCSVKVGILHNKVLDEVERIKIVGNKKEVLEKLNSFEKEFTESEDFKMAYDNILYPDLNIQAIPLTISDQVMNLFAEAIVKADEYNYTKLHRIIEKYIDTVQSTKDLSEDDKQSLYTGFAVFAYSYEYWTIRYPYSKD